jgi:hypothetical protein
MGRDMVLALSSVWVVAIAKPVLDVVGGAPEYWPANRIDRGTIVASAFALSILPPVILGGMVAFGRGRRVQLAMSLYFYSSFLLFLSLGIYQNLSLVLGKPLPLIPASFVAAAATAWFYGRSQMVRTFFSYCSVIALVVPVVFLLTGPTRSLLIHSEEPSGGVYPRVALEAPVVFLLFDELSLASLVNHEGDIDEKLFPNFHRLANVSTWFQNATTNYGKTERSLPSMLTGRLLADDAAETSHQQNPLNLFTIVDAPDGILAVEPVTRLCPPELCGVPPKNLSQAVGQVLPDFWLIYRNIIVPDRYASRIDSIPQRFQDLTRAENTKEDAGNTTRDGRLAVQAVAEWFKEGREKSLVFIHFMVPHIPYSRNPDGTAYLKVSDYSMIGWNTRDLLWERRAPFYAVQGFQRYLLQLMYVDGLLGSILDNLEESGLLGESTLIVTSDHGVAFTAGNFRRSSMLYSAIVGAQNAVPLFWKSPGQTTGTRNARNVELIDVLPTLLEELGDAKDVTWMDGRSMFSGSERGEKRFGGRLYGKDVWPAVLSTSKRRRSEVRLVDNRDGSVFVRPGKYSGLVGRSVDGAATLDDEVELKNPSIFEELSNVDLFSKFRPNFVEGKLSEKSTVDILGVAINGEIVDVVDVHIDDVGRRRFASVFNPSVLNPGRNRLDFARVQLFSSGGGAAFALLRSSRDDFHLKGDTLADAEGRSLREDGNRLVGAFDALGCVAPDLLHIQGWVGDRETWGPPLAYLIVYKGSEVQGKVSDLRSDLPAGLRHTGFAEYFGFPGESCEPEEFRMFVIFDEGTYAEMKSALGMQPLADTTTD